MPNVIISVKHICEPYVCNNKYLQLSRMNDFIRLTLKKKVVVLDYCRSHFFYAVLGIEPRALCILTEPYPQPPQQPFVMFLGEALSFKKMVETK